jgi:bacterioferritin
VCANVQRAFGQPSRVDATHLTTLRQRIINSPTERPVKAPSFRSDIYTLCRRVQRAIATGAANGGAAANSETTVSLLNEVLAIESACALRFEPQYFFAYAECIAARIWELGDSPHYCSDVLLAHAGYLAGTSAKEMAEQDLATERLAMGAYREILAYMQENDLITRRILESVLAQHGQHIENLITQVKILSAREAPPHWLPVPQSASAGQMD